MQPLTKPVQYNTCDAGVLPPERIADFRAYLKAHGCETRDGSGGQHFHVKTPLGWATLVRAKKGQVGTPHWMRAVVEGFLVSSKHAMAPEFWDKFGIAAVNIPRTGPLRTDEKKAAVRSDLRSEVKRRGIQDTSVAMTPRAEILQVERYLDKGTGEVSCAVKGSPGTENLEPYSREAAAVDRLTGLGLASGRDHTVEALVQGGKVLALHAKPSPAPGSANAAKGDAQYLNDLRDDFALHAPLWIKEGESMGDFAARRWAYADAMIKARPASLA